MKNLDRLREKERRRGWGERKGKGCHWYFRR